MRVWWVGFIGGVSEVIVGLNCLVERRALARVRPLRDAILDAIFRVGVGLELWLLLGWGWWCWGEVFPGG